MTTVGCTGSKSSETRAWSGWDWMGRRMPAISASTEESPATHKATFSVAIGPRVVWTPTTLSPMRSMSVTSQFWMMSTPISSPLRAKAHAT